MRFILILSLLFAVPSFSQTIDGGVVDVVFTATEDGGVVLNGVTMPVAVNPEHDPLGVVASVYEAVVNKQWGKLVFVVLSVLVWALRKFLGEKVPFLASKAGTVITVFALAFSGLLATALPSGKPIDAQAVFSTITVAFLASGGWSVWKAVVIESLLPALKQLFNKPVPPAPPPAA